MQQLSWNLPPAPFLHKVSKASHAAIGTYMQLWNLQDNKNNVYIFRDEIRPMLFIKIPKFYNDITDLAGEGVLFWSEKKDKNRILISIELTLWGQDFDQD